MLFISSPYYSFPLPSTPTRLFSLLTCFPPGLSRVASHKSTMLAHYFLLPLFNNQVQIKITLNYSKGDDGWMDG